MDEALGGLGGREGREEAEIVEGEAFLDCGRR